MIASHIEQCRAFLSSLCDKGVVLSEHCMEDTLIMRFTTGLEVEDWLEMSIYTQEDLFTAARLEGLI